jgi:C_GCAxxG_C_C family probable redox protein
VLLALAEQQGIQSDVIPRIATGFCSGLARTGGLCGAVSGAVMAVGLALGRSQPGMETDPAYTVVRRFLERFEAEFGAVTCFELTGVHLGTPEGQAAFRENNVFARCLEYAEGAADIAAELIGADKRMTSQSENLTAAD